MYIGIFPSTTDFAMRPDDIARACEERGFESMWVGEHTHIPASRRTPYMGGGELPPDYYHLHDQFVACTAAAMATTTLTVGTAVSLVIERDPIVLAKQVASLDVLSNGRFVFGVGGGWNAEEMEHHGTPFERRWTVLRERVEAMRLIWTQEEAEYHGEFVDFDPIWCWPKPVQTPHPPILMGSGTERGRARVIRYCDGWLPNVRMMPDLPAAVQDLREKAEAAGRDPETIPISMFWGKPKPEALDEYQALGAERVIFGLPAASTDDTLSRLDRLAEFIPAYA